MLMTHLHNLHLHMPGAQAASATGAARETAQEAVRRAEDTLQAAKDKAAQTASSAYQATKGKAYETYGAGRDTAQQAAQAAVEHAEAALQAARDKVGMCVAASAVHVSLSRASIVFMSMCVDGAVKVAIYRRCI